MDESITSKHIVLWYTLFVNEKELIKAELGLEPVSLYIDNRSHFFFFMKHEKENYMVLLKNEIEAQALPLLRKFNSDYPELPTFIKETDSLMLFDIPNGKLTRLVEENIDESISSQAKRLQDRLNELTKKFGYYFDWELNYFFVTNGKLMYIDLETLEIGTNSKLLNMPIYSELSLEDRVKLKIKKENKQLSNHARFTKWLK